MLTTSYIQCMCVLYIESRYNICSLVSWVPITKTIILQLYCVCVCVYV